MSWYVYTTKLRTGSVKPKLLSKVQKLFLQTWPQWGSGKYSSWTAEMREESDICCRHILTFIVQIWSTRWLQLSTSMDVCSPRGAYYYMPLIQFGAKLLDLQLMIILDTLPQYYRYVMYRMAGNFGGEYILADWRFWEQSANISSAKNFPVWCHNYCKIIACVLGLQLDAPV